MQTEMDRTIGNLRVLAALSHNDKLMTRGEDFDIYVPTTWRSFVRSFYREGRASNIEKVRKTVREGFRFASSTLEAAMSLIESEKSNSPLSFESASAFKVNFLINTTAMDHIRMVDSLGACVPGLKNLASTYKDDPVLASQIGVVLEEVDNYISVTQSHTTSLRERVLVRNSLPCVPNHMYHSKPSEPLASVLEESPLSHPQHLSCEEESSPF